MEKLKTMKEIAKELAHEAMKNITLNGMTLEEFIKRMNNVNDRKECRVASCRYNKNCICQNEDKRKECVDVSMKVLCLEGSEEQEKPLITQRIQET